MPFSCCVPICNSDGRRDDCKGSISFHTFPKDEKLMKAWIVAIRRDPGANFKLTKSTRVCSKHFPASAFELDSGFRVRKRLKKDAVPSLFEWTPSKVVRRPLERNKLIPMLLSNGEKENVSCEADVEVVCKIPLPLGSNSSTDSLQYIDTPCSPDKSTLNRTNLRLLELRNKEKFSVLRFCTSDADIKYYTGFPSYKAMDCFFNFLLPEANFLYYVGSENTSSGIPYELLCKRGPSRSLSPMEEFFITLVRLRKGFPERLIADLYNLSEGYVSKIINTWLIFLFDRLRCIPIWPGKDLIKNSLPSAFKEMYPSTRVIVDCTEIFIENPSAADCQRETFSSYKHRNTAKGLIGITPHGQISYISPLYAGRCSDKKIVRHCGILDLLEEGDGLMVDRGFDIASDLEPRGIKLIMPAFLQGQNQFTEDQIKNSRNIASVRVHVERAVRKMKEFNILSNIVPITLCPSLERIWIICGHLANFTGGLFKEQ